MKCVIICLKTLFISCMFLLKTKATKKGQGAAHMSTLCSFFCIFICLFFLQTRFISCFPVLETKRATEGRVRSTNHAVPKDSSLFCVSLSLRLNVLQKAGCYCTNHASESQARTFRDGVVCAPHPKRLLPHSAYFLKIGVLIAKFSLIAYNRSSSSSSFSINSHMTSIASSWSCFAKRGE